MEYVDVKNGNYTKDSIKKVAESIKSGEIVVIPTDTVYGLAADALNEKAVKEIYDLKNRKLSNPMSVLVSNMEMIEKVTTGVSDIEKNIIQKFFPGALTIIFEKNSIVPDIVTSGLNTIRHKNAR